MSIRGTGKKIETELSATFCDFCEKQMDFETGIDHSLHMSFDFGFHSKRDGQNWTWDACHNCVEKIIPHLESLRKPPHNDEYHGAD